MISVKIDGLKALERSLKEFPKAAAHATRQTLTDAARAFSGLVAAEMGNKLIMRSSWLVRTNNVKPASISKMEATFTNRNEFLDKIDEGGREHRTSRALPAAAGEGKTSATRKKLVRGPNKMAALKALAPTRGKSRKQANLIAVKQAARRGGGIVTMKLANGNEGLFRVTRGTRPKVTQLHRTHTGGANVPAHPLLKPAMAKLLPKVDKIFEKNIEAQLRRLKLWGR